MLSSSGTPAQVNGVELANALAEAVQGKVKTNASDLDRQAMLDMAPRAVVRPETEEDVATVLAVASRLGAAVVPRGGGTRMHLGNAPRGYDVALDLRSVDAVVEHQPADLTVTVQAGCTLAALQEVLGKEGQFLPVDPPLPEQATVGGTLAVSWGGPLRAAYGPPRDWVIGMRAALPNGTVVKSGGKVVKNVTGYAMDRLFIGSLGTLGVILEATCKVLPFPRTTRTVTASFKSPDAALAAVQAVRRDGLTPMSAELVNGALGDRLDVPIATRGTWTLFLRAGGRQSTVQRLVDAFARRCRETGAPRIEAADGDDETRLWRALADAGHGKSPPPLVFHIAGLPDQGVRLVALVEAMGGTSSLGEPGIAVSASYGGLSAFFWQDAELEETMPAVLPALGGAIASLREQTATLGGEVVVERMPEGLRAVTDAFSPPTPSFRIMRGLKDEYDPVGILNPGRFVGGI